MADLNLAFLPAALQGIVFDGWLESALQEALYTTHLWRQLCVQERHRGGIGEQVTKTKPGLIPPQTEAEIRINRGQEPGIVTPSYEQYTYKLRTGAKSMELDIPTNWVAAIPKILSDIRAFYEFAAHTLSRVCRSRVYAAYGAGDTFATASGAASTSVEVQDVTGFDKVIVNGIAVDVSVSNPLPILIGGVARNVTAVAPADSSSPPQGPGTLTISAAHTWALHEAVVRVDAPKIIRAAGRVTDRLLVAGDVATFAPFRSAVAFLRDNNVPGVDGTRNGPYGAFVDGMTEAALLGDVEFRQAFQGRPETPAIRDGVIGQYGGIIFYRNTDMPTLSGSPLQTTIRRSIVFGADVAIEAYAPEQDFETAPPDVMEVALNMHYKRKLDLAGVMTAIFRAPLDALGRSVLMSYVTNYDYCIPTDVKAIGTVHRHKRAVVIHTAGA